MRKYDSGFTGGEVDTPKTTNSIREVALPDGLLSEIEAWKKVSIDTQPEAWVFASEKLTPLSRDNCWRRHIGPKLKEAGLGWATFQVMSFTGIVGGFVAETVISNLSFKLYFDRAFSGVEFVDYIPATLKTAVFGFIIGTVSSYLGYNARGGAEGVGRASTKSVVFSSILLILANVVLVKVIIFIFPDKLR